ncbi:MAG: class I SAM-dependent methyltransferase [Candidatus Diapherotrites archaeon]|nr:class I SAM-dependent methyltransferase [Candidatus Diapherotrites archaeon]
MRGRRRRLRLSTDKKTAESTIKKPHVAKVGKTSGKTGHALKNSRLALRRKKIRMRIEHNIDSFVRRNPNLSAGSARLLCEMYEQLVFQTPSFKVSDSLERDLAELFKRNGIKHILEVGPAPYGGLVSRISHIALKAGAKVHAIDLLPPANYIPKELDYRVGDVKNLESVFPGQKFDIIIAHGVFEPGGNPFESIEEAHLLNKIRKTHAAVRVLLRSMSENPRGFIVLSGHSSKVPLRRDWVEKSAKVVKWERRVLDITDAFYEHIAESLRDSPHLRERYLGRAIKQFASVLVIKKKLRKSAHK